MRVDSGATETQSLFSSPLNLQIDELVCEKRKKMGFAALENNDTKPLIQSSWHTHLKRWCVAWLRWPKVPRRAGRDDWMFNGTFHEAVRGVLMMAQLFSIMPVRGILAKDPRKLRFSYTSGRAVYAYFCAVGIGFLAVMSVYFFASKRYHFQKMVTAFFYCYNLYAMYRFARLGQKWPALMVKWTRVDDSLPPQKDLFERAVLAYRIKLCSIIVMTLSLSEHLLSIVAAVHYSNNCPAVHDPYEAFFKSNFAFVYYYFSYSTLRGFLTKFFNVICNFVWSYVDLFVIVISMGLSHSFRRINAYLFLHKREKMSEQFWGEQRQKYRNVCDLVTTVDDHISAITMLSISNNLFFICVQILNSMNSRPTLVHTVYFWFNLIILIGRTLAVAMFAAEVNDESKRPIEVLRTIPRDGWCLETKRFAEEVTTDTVALTGLKFFSMTRKLVLNVTGAIITYELVLIQFHKDEVSDVDLCLIDPFDEKYY
uniref:Gustatory receptor n=1 Tax=Anopheles culicifacies TaxID=139723 RepID=A0A182LWX8_9DIPT